MRSRRAWVLGCVPLFTAVCGIAIHWFIQMDRVFHDKAVNANALQRIRQYEREIPLRTVVLPHNRWTDNAFVAEPSTNGAGAISVLIVDDHYRGSDPAYRTDAGLIGDEISLPLLCSLPSQAAAKGVRLDAVVMRSIHTRCQMS